MRIGTTGQFVGGGLSYDAEVEYIRNTGSEFIDTNLMFSDFEVTVTFTQYAVLSNAFIWSGENAGYYSYLYPMIALYSRGVSIGWNYDVTDNCGSNVAGTHTVVYNRKNADESRTCLFDGTVVLTKTTPPATTNLNTIHLYWRSREGVTTKVFDIKSFSVKDNSTGIVVLDAIPVRVGTIGYMYDRVSKALFGNAGTGAFTLGPDKT